MSKIDNVTVESAEIFFRNFSGRAGPYNNEGDRSFACGLPQDVAEAMAADGWNVKFPEPREEGDTPTPYLPVEVKYNNYPPRVVMISSTTRTELDEKTVSSLDHVTIKNVDLIVRPYEWTVNGKSGVKAYLKTMFLTIDEDELERKYAEQDPGAEFA